MSAFRARRITKSKENEPFLAQHIMGRVNHKVSHPAICTQKDVDASQLAIRRTGNHIAWSSVHTLCSQYEGNCHCRTVRKGVDA